jgi:hypothetical protein
LIAAGRAGEGTAPRAAVVSIDQALPDVASSIRAKAPPLAPSDRIGVSWKRPWIFPPGDEALRRQGIFRSLDVDIKYVDFARIADRCLPMARIAAAMCGSAGSKTADTVKALDDEELADLSENLIEVAEYMGGTLALPAAP